MIQPRLPSVPSKSAPILGLLDYPRGPEMNPIRRISSHCCAPIRSGHVAAAPPMSEMNCRRLINCSPEEAYQFTGVSYHSRNDWSQDSFGSSAEARPSLSSPITVIGYSRAQYQTPQSTSHVSTVVNLHQFRMRPFDRLLRRHALHGCGVHVGENVFRHDLSRLTARRTWPAAGPRRQDHVLERRHHRVLVPQRVLCPFLCRWNRESLLRHEPLLEHRARAYPAQEILCRLLVLRIAHNHVRL